MKIGRRAFAHAASAAAAGAVVAGFSGLRSLPLPAWGEGLWFDAADRHVAFGRSCAGAFRLLLAHRDHITRVTFWGVSDAESWLNRGRVYHPLLWDRQRRPKPAFDAVVSVLTGNH